MAQQWHDLLFAHWPIAPQVMRAHVPPQLPLDLWEGQAWIAVVPFRMYGVRPRGVPALPLLSAFAELNVRTYVTLDGKPGVFFFSLDAANPPAVLAARLIPLPYYWAAMSVRQARDGWVEYDSRRLPLGRPARFRARYRPIGPVFNPLPGSIEHFLAERYCLYSVDGRGVVRRLEIHHPPWPLRVAEARIERNTMVAAAGIGLPDVPPLLHFAERQEMVNWAPYRTGTGPSRV
jgi:uncharacterized protein YqjF (DUF2071 family)